MSRTPIFPMPMEPNHYGDYGFDPQTDYFQILEEARRQSKRAEARPLDGLHFKLQKPISKDGDAKAKKRRRWWKWALNFWSRSKPSNTSSTAQQESRCSRPYCRPVSGPIYATDSVRAAASQCRASSGPLMAAEVGPVDGLAYVSLRGVDGFSGTIGNVPIYLVT